MQKNKKNILTLLALKVILNFKINMNKKTLLTMLLLTCVSVMMLAQGYGSRSYLAAPSKNEYLIKDPVWFISVGGGAQMYFGEDDSKGPFAKRITVAPTLTIGRRMSNWINLRMQLTGGSLHGFNDGFSGTYTRWSKESNYDPKNFTKDPAWDYMGWKEGVDYRWSDYYQSWEPIKYGESERVYMQHLRYIGAYFDVSLNVLNFFGGYQPERKIEVSPFVGLGVYQRFAHRGNLNGSFVGGSAGLNASYKIAPNFSIFGEGRFAVVSDEFDGQNGSSSNNAMASVTAGITYHFGSPRYIDPAIDRRLSLPYNIAKAKDKTVLVPGGNIEIGSGVDPVWKDKIPTTKVSVSPFWMDETEVTNAQYREFVCWVRDSIIRDRLADPAYGGNAEYRNWNKSIPWKNPNQREAAAISTVVGGIYKNNGTDLDGLNASTLNYRYNWFDSNSYVEFIAESAKGNGLLSITKDTAYVSENGDIIRETITRVSGGSKVDFTNTYIINVYPDVLSWIDDFPNSKNEQYSKMYFTAKAFDKYPVVGVSWEQAEAFCTWRTIKFYYENKGNVDGYEPYRLPTEAEWEFAARNGQSEFSYPWFSNDTHTSDGLSNMNFRGSNDLKDILAPVATFLPNRFGLYDMAGNVAEWTTTTYVESLDSRTGLVNPNYDYRATISDPSTLKRKVIKGGSWKDTSSASESTSRAFEYQNKGRSYIGFRCVRSWGIDNKGNVR